MKKNCSLILILLLAVSFPAATEEGPQVDFILLVDTSLSMAPAIDDLKQFVAGGIVGRFVREGDWVAVLAFYGTSTLIWEGDIQTEADKAALVRSLHALEATGRFTDIGAALDEMKRLVVRRNKPEIPKYILLLTDEVQEAPPGSAYHSDDFTISHELLEYVRRVDLGSFQAITIGYGLASRIESDLASLMKTLNDPPDRPERLLPGENSVKTQEASKLEAPGSTLPGVVAEAGTETSKMETRVPDGTAGSASADVQRVTATRTETDGGESINPWLYLILALVMGIAIMGALLLMTQRSKKPMNTGGTPEEKENENDPPGFKDGKR